MDVAPTAMPEDLEPIDALFREVSRYDGRPALSEFKEIRVRRSGSGWQDVVGRDEADRALAGYAMTAYHPAPVGRPRGHWAIEMAIRPDRRTSEVAGALLDGALRLVPPGGLVGVWACQQSQLDALAARGFVERRVLLELECSLPIAEPPRFPPDVRLRRFVRHRDEEAWLRLNNEAFAGHPENGALTMADLDERFSQPWFDPNGILLASVGERLMGSCWTKRHEDGTGEIYIIGVHPDAWGLGYGRALVIAGLGLLHGDFGCKRAVLYVEGDNRAALGLYRSLGFSEFHRTAQFAPANRPW